MHVRVKKLKKKKKGGMQPLCSFTSVFCMQAQHKGKITQMFPLCLEENVSNFTTLLDTINRK